LEDAGPVSIEGIDLDYDILVRGFHTVFLTVYDEWNNSATTNVTVEAIDNTNPFADAGADQTVAIGTTVVMDGSGSHDDGTIKKYNWSFDYNGQKRAMNGKTISFKFDKAGTYEILLKVFDQSDNVGTDTVTITVKNTGVVKGIVLDDKGKPIDGALVEIVASDGKTYTFTTAPDGSFSLAIPPGSFTWKISKNGYETIMGSSSVDILGENTLDLSGTPMKKSANSGTNPILFIVPVVIVILLIVGLVIFLVMRKKKSDTETTEEPKEEAIETEPAESGAPAETPLPPEALDFVQAPPVMEEDVPVEKVEQNTTVDDLLVDGSDHGDEERLNSEVSS
jgi:heme/copper-type cytochrome/quinol oxidase subunit 2